MLSRDRLSHQVADLFESNVISRAAERDLSLSWAGVTWPDLNWLDIGQQSMYADKRRVTVILFLFVSYDMCGLL